MLSECLALTFHAANLLSPSGVSLFQKVLRLQLLADSIHVSLHGSAVGVLVRGQTEVHLAVLKELIGLDLEEKTRVYTSLDHLSWSPN